MPKTLPTICPISASLHCKRCATKLTSRNPNMMLSMSCLTQTKRSVHSCITYSPTKSAAWLLHIGMRRECIDTRLVAKMLKAIRAQENKTTARERLGRLPKIYRI